MKKISILASIWVGVLGFAGCTTSTINNQNGLACMDAAECDDGRYCNGTETCVSNVCSLGSDSCPGQGCDENTDACIASSVTLDAMTTFQIMTGWEALADAQAFQPSFAHYKDEVFDLTVDDLGLNRLRLEIRSGAENQQDYWQLFRNNPSCWREVRYSTVNDNADPFNLNLNGFRFSEMDNTIDTTVLPIKQRVEANGEKLFINLNYVAFTSQIAANCIAGLTYLHDDPNEYAEFVLATHLHLQNKYGWVPDAWEIILEPDNVIEWDGALIGQAIVAAQARLSANGFTQRYIGPSTTNMANAISYFNDMAAISGALQHVSELSYHRYGGVSTANLLTIANLAATHGIGTAMLEHVGSGHQDLHTDLKVGNNTAWQQYAIATVTPNDNGVGFYLIDQTSETNPIVTIGNRTKFLRQYFKYVRAGAKRIAATANDAVFDPIAFVNVNGRTVVIVKASTGGQFAIENLPAGTYGIKYTTNSVYDVNRTDQTLVNGQDLVTSIPASGVLTVFAR